MAEQKESSVLFSLNELMGLEEERIKEEEAAKAAQAEAERKAREAEELRLRQEEQRKLDEEEAKRRAAEMAVKEEEARLEAIRQAEIEKAKAEAENEARLLAMKEQQRHEAQLAALELPNTGVALAIDIGEADDIHPKNKQDVGKRLALNALNQDYGKKVLYKGPAFKSAKVKNGTVTVTFSDAKGLKTSDGGAVKGFALAGADGNFVWADATIKGTKVVVSAEGVSEPAQILYAWQDNPEVNLYNGVDLPAVPFRADLTK